MRLCVELYDLDLVLSDGREISLENYRGKVLLIVNTAGRCGLTPQYEELEVLYQRYQSQGLEILAFPCNQFAGQEPGSNEEIAEFCYSQFNISFSLFQKINVNGEETHPLFQYLKEKAPGVLGSKSIKWNFTKFLISSDAQTVLRYSPKTSPSSLEGEIKKFLTYTKV